MINRRASEYANTYISVKGGSQEVAAIVANLNQPDFGDTFIGWMQTVNSYPRAFDFKYESITSILDISIKSLFAYTSDKYGNLCNETQSNNCPFGTTIEEFEEIWFKKLKSLKYAITVYLKEKNGLTLTKFFIEKGDNVCKFNILNYLAPYWKEILTGGQEYRISFTMNTPVNISEVTVEEEFYIKNNDEIIFMKREDFWLARHKDERYSYQSAKLLNEPFKSLNKSFINIFGLVLEYKEADATLYVADMAYVLSAYSNKTGCDLQHRYVYYTNKDKSTSMRVSVFLNYDKTIDEDDEEFRRKRETILGLMHDSNSNDHLVKCQNFLKLINWNIETIRNYSPFWIKLWGKMVGIIDYVDPIQAVIRTWNLPFAVLPCHLKWSNNLMMVLSKNDDGKCLKFTAATEGEIFVVIASTPSNQKTWYTLQITTRGVIFYRVCN